MRRSPVSEVSRRRARLVILLGAALLIAAAAKFGAEVVFCMNAFRAGANSCLAQVAQAFPGDPLSVGLAVLGVVGLVVGLRLRAPTRRLDE